MSANSSAMTGVVVVIVTLLLLAGCSPVGYIVRPDPPGPAATLTVIRPPAFTGGGTTTVVRVGGADVVGLRSGQHATFPIPAGHTVVTSDCMGWIVNRPGGAEFTAEPNQRYWVIVGYRTPGYACYIDGPLGEEEGRAMMVGTRAAR